MKLKKYLNESKDDESWRAIENSNLEYSFYLHLTSNDARFSFCRSPNYIIEGDYDKITDPLWRINDKTENNRVFEKYKKLREKNKASMDKKRKQLAAESKDILDTALSLIKAKLQKVRLEEDTVLEGIVKEALKK